MDRSKSAAPPARPSWRGHLKLSLVTCPVALYTATSAAGDVHFHLVNPKTHNRIRMVPTDPEAGPVERSDLIRGFEVERGRYVFLTEEDMASVKLESTRTIDIERFVDAASIDRLYWNAPYFLVPDGKMAAESFAVIREAMRAARQVALGRVVLSTRERLMALEPRDQGIVATSLRTYDEVRDPEALFDAIPEVKIDASMVEIARKIIEQQEGPFDPSRFTDRYEEALKAVIARKEKGRAPIAVAEPADTNVVDLMAALKASLAGGHGGRKAPAHRPARAHPKKPERRRRASG